LGTYLVKRFLLMILTLIGISIIIFVLLRLMPGNIVDIMFDSAGFVDPAEKALIEKELGLDLPIPVQYYHWIKGMLVWDLGFSYVSEMPAIDELGPRIPITAKLAALALFFSILFGLPLGVISAVKQDTALDYILRIISLSGLSLPSFWLVNQAQFERYHATSNQILFLAVRGTDSRRVCNKKRSLPDGRCWY
jgi:peptide/nickel transport system permease protein